MEIKIISTEIIKPSSPTLQHLRTYKLFLPNDKITDSYFPMILFYSAPSRNAIEISNHLKSSLSKTLSYYYPFAGQIKDGVSTDCNDHGVIFIETQVANEMSEALQRKDHDDLLKPLLPLEGNLQEIPSTYHASLVVQVNYFACGGIMISICFSHLIADATTATNFIKNWAEVARGATSDIKNVIVDYTPIYRSCIHDVMATVKSLYSKHYQFPSEIVTKLFTFDGTKIATLREKMGDGPYLDRPTRFEAISTLILGSLINVATTRERDEFTATQLVAVIPINLRNKMNPPLPPQSIGNLLIVAIPKLPMDKRINYNYVAGKLRESIRKAVDQYKTNVYESGVIEEEILKSKIFAVSDWSRLPYYEADFGWGNPIWVCVVGVNEQAAILLQTSDGEGIEAWINLPSEEMANFEKDPQILAYASLN